MESKKVSLFQLCANRCENQSDDLNACSHSKEPMNRFANRGWGGGHSMFSEKKNGLPQKSSLDPLKRKSVFTSLNMSERWDDCSPAHERSPVNKDAAVYMIEDDSDQADSPCAKVKLLPVQKSSDAYSSEIEPLTSVSVDQHQSSSDMSPSEIESATSVSGVRRLSSTRKLKHLFKPETKRSLFVPVEEKNLQKESIATIQSDCHSPSQYVKRFKKGYKSPRIVNCLQQVPESPLSCSPQTPVATHTPNKIELKNHRIDESSTCDSKTLDSDRESSSGSSDCIPPSVSLPLVSDSKIKGSEWIRSLSTPTKDCTQDLTEKQNRTIGSVRKTRYIKGGFAEQLENVLMEERSERAFREQMPTPDSKHLTVRVTKMVTPDVGHILVDCIEVDSPGSASSAMPVCLNLSPGDTLALMLSAKTAQRLTIWVGSVLQLTPPWQILHLPSIAKSVILCPTVSNIHLPLCSPAMQDDVQEYHWRCPCSQDPTLPSNSCPAKTSDSQSSMEYLHRL